MGADNSKVEYVSSNELRASFAEFVEQRCDRGADRYVALQDLHIAFDTFLQEKWGARLFSYTLDPMCIEHGFRLSPGWTEHTQKWTFVVGVDLKPQ